MDTDETILFARPEFEGQLAQLLRNAAAENAVTEHVAYHQPVPPMPPVPHVPVAPQHHEDHTVPGVPGVPTAPTAPTGATGAPQPSSPMPRHRRQRRVFVRVRGPRQGGKKAWWLRAASTLLAAAASAIVAMLSVLGGLTSYEPLRDIAAPGVSGTLAAWWPLLIYGPWVVASLSILRAALHQRGALHAWLVMAGFSGLAVALCVADAPDTVTGVAVAGLAPLSSLVAFHQLVRQITLINPPRHALPRQRG